MEPQLPPQTPRHTFMPISRWTVFCALKVLLAALMAEDQGLGPAGSV